MMNLKLISYKMFVLICFCVGCSHAPQMAKLDQTSSKMETGQWVIATGLGWTVVGLKMRKLDGGKYYLTLSDAKNKEIEHPYSVQYTTEKNGKRYVSSATFYGIHATNLYAQHGRFVYEYCDAKFNSKGLFHGPLKCFIADKQLLHVEFQNGVRHGRYFVKDLSGNYTYTGQYKQNKPVGKHTRYYQSGEKAVSIFDEYSRRSKVVFFNIMDEVTQKKEFEYIGKTTNQTVYEYCEGEKLKYISQYKDRSFISTQELKGEDNKPLKCEPKSRFRISFCGTIK